MELSGDVATRRMAVWARSRAVVLVGSVASAVVMLVLVAVVMLPLHMTALRWARRDAGVAARVCS
jgi:riboflavin transporter FmnP